MNYEKREKILGLSVQRSLPLFLISFHTSYFILHSPDEVCDGPVSRDRLQAYHGWWYHLPLAL